MNTIDGYDDIHDNVRYWLGRLVEEAAGRGRSGGETRRGPVVVYDIGANDGEITLPALTEAGGVRIVAFEPLPAARSRLIAGAGTRNASFALWGEADVTIVPLALGDEDRMIEIDVYDDDTFSSLYERSPEERERYHLTAVERISVRMRPLDDLLAKGIIPPPDIVKIDVEGAELAVLRGGGETLRTHRPPVLMEFSCVNTENAGYDRHDLIDELRRCGYDEVYGLFRNHDRLLYDGEMLRDCRVWNVIALHRDNPFDLGH